MTGREHLSRQKRWVTGGAIVAWGTFAVACFAGNAQDSRVLFAIGLGAAVAFGGVILYAIFLAFRCPWCRGNLGQLAHAHLERIKFCPYCGHRLDEELPEAEAASSIEST